MYKLVFLILALAGFLIYKATAMRVKRLPTVKPAIVKTKEISKNPKQTPASAKTKAEVQKTAPAPANAEMNQYDSLAEVFSEPDAIEVDRLTPEEREAHEANLRLIKRIEEEAAQKKRSQLNKVKSWEQLTPEEKKKFEIYQKFENNGE